jgi:CheY-like chemotaxis protein
MVITLVYPTKQIVLCCSSCLASNGPTDSQKKIILASRLDKREVSLTVELLLAEVLLGNTHSQSASKAARQAGQKILLVDDSSTTLLIEEMVLTEHTQYELVLARDGEEAVEKAISEQPNLILMDVVMPRMNGFEACREMRRHEALRKVPIIMVTSRGESYNVEQGFESGCNDYVTKPIDGAELVEIVNGYLIAQG